MPRTQRKPLSRDRVLQAAVDLADRDGIDALTMRNLAADLGVEAMSLYHHVANKEAILDGVVEVVVAEINGATAQVPDPPVRTTGRPCCGPDPGCPPGAAGPPLGPGRDRKPHRPDPAGRPAL
jgi:AcrR family transcriptional regulator